MLIHGRPATFGSSPNAKWAGGSNRLDMGKGGHMISSVSARRKFAAVVDILLWGWPGGRLAQPATLCGLCSLPSHAWWNLHKETTTGVWVSQAAEPSMGTS